MFNGCPQGYYKVWFERRVILGVIEGLFKRLLKEKLKVQRDTKKCLLLKELLNKVFV